MIKIHAFKGTHHYWDDKDRGGVLCLKFVKDVLKKCPKNITVWIEENTKGNIEVRQKRGKHAEWRWKGFKEFEEMWDELFKQVSTKKSKKIYTVTLWLQEGRV
jgi:hypothetical protein